MKITQLDAIFKNTLATSTNPSTEEAYASFSAALEEAKKIGNAKEAYEAYMNGPTHPFKTQGQLLDGTMFPPEDASPEFLLAWNKTLNELPAVPRVLLTDAVCEVLEYGDYSAPIISDAERIKNARNTLDKYGCEGLLELTEKALQKALKNNIAFGNEPIYINNLRDCLFNCQQMIDLLQSLKQKHK